MNRFSLISFALVAVLAAGSSQAQSAQGDTSQSQAAPAKGTQAIKPGDRNCLRDTGSLIKPKDGHCLPVAGRSYSQDDIRRTGQNQVGPALQQLDPSISVR